MDNINPVHFTNQPKKDENKITTQIQLKKKSGFGKLKTSLFGEDDGENLGKSILECIIWPATKDIIYNSVTSIANTVIYGTPISPNAHRREGSSGVMGRPYYDYGGASSTRSRGEPVRRSSGYTTTNEFDFRNIPIPDTVEKHDRDGNIISRQSALEFIKESINDMQERWEMQDGVLSAQDALDILGIKRSIPPTMVYFGWTDLSGVTYTREPGFGWTIHMPKLTKIT